MKRRQLEFDPDAAAEAAAAYRWYLQRSPNAAAGFLDELETALEKVLESPFKWPILGRRVRRCLFRRFPYMVIYAVNDERILVLAIAHGRRRPGYWRSRASS